MDCTALSIAFVYMPEHVQVDRAGGDALLPLSRTVLAVRWKPSLRLRYSKSVADDRYASIGDFRVVRDGLHSPVAWIHPK